MWILRFRQRHRRRRERVLDEKRAKNLIKLNGANEEAKEQAKDEIQQKW